jgi:hypothetical protein
LDVQALHCEFSLSKRTAGVVEAVSLILLLVAVAWFWLDSARAREIATGVARGLCSSRGLQFLDGTASLTRVGIRGTRGGIRLRRVFRFDYSEAGIGRHSGHIAMVGMDLEDASLGLPGDGGAENPRSTLVSTRRPEMNSTRDDGGG